jgi:hypothetical protein
VQNVTTYITKVTKSVTDVSLRLAVLEEQTSQATVKIDSTHRQVEKHLKDIRI